MKNANWDRITELSRSELIDAVREHVGTDELAAYLKAPFGYFAGLYANGVFHVGQDVGNEIAEHERPIFLSHVPGIGNLDSSAYTIGYAEMDENGKYVRKHDGSMIGDGSFDALIDDICENGEVSEWVEELISDLVSE